LRVFYYNKNPFVHALVFSPNSNRYTWANNKYEIYCKHWFFFVLSLPNQIKNETKLKCIKDHGNNTELFTYERIFRDRSKNYVDKERFKQVEIFFRFVSDTPIWYVKLLIHIPFKFFKILKKCIPFSNIL